MLEFLEHTTGIMRKKLEKLTRVEAYKIYTTIALLFGTLFALTAPPLTGIDETSHFSRAFQVAHGGIFPQESGDKLFGGYLPQNYLPYVAMVHAKLGEKQPVDYQEVLDYAYNYKFSDDSAFITFPGSGVYSPLPYIPAAVGILLSQGLNLSIGHTVLLARLFTLITVIAIVALAIRYLEPYKIKWLVVVMALFPKVIFQSSIISTDGLLNALTLLIFAIFIKILISKRTTKSELVVLAVSSIILPLVKFNYIFISLIVLFIPYQKISMVLDRRKAIYYKILVVVIAVILSVAWVYSVRGSANSIRTMRGDGALSQVDAKKQVEYLFSNPLAGPKAVVKTVYTDERGYADSIAGVLGWNYVQLPNVIIIGSFFLLVLSAAYARDEIVKMKRQILHVLALMVFAILSIFGILYLTFTPVGLSTVDGVQGRYFTPFVPFIASALVAMIPLTLKINEKTAKKIFFITSAIFLLIALTTYIKIVY